jgi:RNA polymerase sigma-70 factor (ECF subfamily)
MSTKSPRHGSEEAPDAVAAKRAHPVTSLSLLHRARAKDQSAWDRLFYLYRPLVLYWCSCWGVRHEDAEDVAQEVFREVADSLSSFQEDRPGTTFRGWLRGVARNQLLMHFRRTGKHVQGEGGSSALKRLEQVSEPGDQGEDDPVEQLSGLYRRALELVRAEFEDRTWQMFWRAVIDGRTPSEIATELNVGDASVRQAKSRVLRRLREEVGVLIS